MKVGFPLGLLIYQLMGREKIPCYCKVRVEMQALYVVSTDTIWGRASSWLPTWPSLTPASLSLGEVQDTLLAFVAAGIKTLFLWWCFAGIGVFLSIVFYPASQFLPCSLSRTRTFLVGPFLCQHSLASAHYQLQVWDIQGKKQTQGNNYHAMWKNNLMGIYYNFIIWKPHDEV